MSEHDHMETDAPGGDCCGGGGDCCGGDDHDHAHGHSHSPSDANVYIEY